jgi:hypothetical protein
MSSIGSSLTTMVFTTGPRFVQTCSALPVDPRAALPPSRAPLCKHKHNEARGVRSEAAHCLRSLSHLIDNTRHAGAIAGATRGKRRECQCGLCHQTGQCGWGWWGGGDAGFTAGKIAGRFDANQLAARWRRGQRRHGVLWLLWRQEEDQREEVTRARLLSL